MRFLIALLGAMALASSAVAQDKDSPAKTITLSDVQAAQLLIANDRLDDAVTLAFTLLNRRFDYHGFTPRFSYVFTEQHSDIPLYSFTRNQFQIGVTSLF